jgi:hypothetical protein
MGFNAETGEFDSQPFKAPREFTPELVRDMQIPSLSYIQHDERYLDDNRDVKLWLCSQALSYADVIGSAIAASQCGDGMPAYYRLFKIPAGFIMDLSFLELDIEEATHNANFEALSSAESELKNEYADVIHVLFNEKDLHLAQSAIAAYGLDVTGTSVQEVSEDISNAWQIEEDKKE